MSALINSKPNLSPKRKPSAMNAPDSNGRENLPYVVSMNNAKTEFSVKIKLENWKKAIYMIRAQFTSKKFCSKK